MSRETQHYCDDDSFLTRRVLKCFEDDLFILAPPPDCITRRSDLRRATTHSTVTIGDCSLLVF